MRDLERSCDHEQEREGDPERERERERKGVQCKLVKNAQVHAHVIMQAAQLRKYCMHAVHARARTRTHARACTATGAGACASISERHARSHIAPPRLPVF